MFFSILWEKITWANNRKGTAFIKEKLDRVVANQIEMSLFSDSFYTVLP